MLGSARGFPGGVLFNMYERRLGGGGSRESAGCGEGQIF